MGCNASKANSIVEPPFNRWKPKATRKKKRDLSSDRKLDNSDGSFEELDQKAALDIKSRTGKSGLRDLDDEAKVSFEKEAADEIRSEVDTDEVKGDLPMSDKDDEPEDDDGGDEEATGRADDNDDAEGEEATGRGDDIGEAEDDQETGRGDDNDDAECDEEKGRGDDMGDAEGDGDKATGLEENAGDAEGDEATGRADDGDNAEGDEAAGFAADVGDEATGHGDDVGDAESHEPSESNQQLENEGQEEDASAGQADLNLRSAVGTERVKRAADTNDDGDDRERPDSNGNDNDDRCDHCRHEYDADDGESVGDKSEGDDDKLGTYREDPPDDYESGNFSTMRSNSFNTGRSRNSVMKKYTKRNASKNNCCCACTAAKIVPCVLKMNLADGKVRKIKRR